MTVPMASTDVSRPELFTDQKYAKLHRDSVEFLN